ncbi:DUF6082 family protein [Actinosynnema sp. NPDC050436]|uniref:DUF6082 family protein n=1 Tax=Actinosynnema sp. NPDC050436 TaxID=3155659 RepID=UPI0034003332
MSSCRFLRAGNAGHRRKFPPVTPTSRRRRGITRKWNPEPITPAGPRTAGEAAGPGCRVRPGQACGCDRPGCRVRSTFGRLGGENRAHPTGRPGRLPGRGQRGPVAASGGTGRGSATSARPTGPPPVFAALALGGVAAALVVFRGEPGRRYWRSARDSWHGRAAQRRRDRRFVRVVEDEHARVVADRASAPERDRRAR